MSTVPVLRPGAVVKTFENDHANMSLGVINTLSIKN